MKTQKNPFHFREEKRKEEMSPLFCTDQRLHHLVCHLEHPALREGVYGSPTNEHWTSDITKRKQME